MLIKDLISLRSFDPVINLNWAGKVDEQTRLLANYIMTEDLADIFVDMLESITMVRSASRREKLQDINNSMKRAHILSGQYGTGKSYFLLMLNIVLEMKNSTLADNLIKQFADYPELQYQLKLIRENKKYFIVRISGDTENEKEFKDVIQREVTNTLEEAFPDISLSSVYKKALETFDGIVGKYETEVENYLQQKEYTIRDVRMNLHHHKRLGLTQYEEVTKAVLFFTPPIEIDRLEDFLLDADKVLKEKGYDELIIIFDEFSAYISASMENKRLNKDLGQIQNLAELTSTSRDGNISFVASTHTDVVQMLGKYDESMKEMLDKVFGRFQGHTLTFDQGEELLKSTIQVEDSRAMEKLFYKHEEFIKGAEERFNRKLKDFYPLHPATASFLEPISNQYAQKTRTTFTFLEEVIRKNFYNQPIEKGGKINLITLSDLYDYFEKEIKSGNQDLVEEFNKIYNEVKSEEDLIDYAKALVLAYSNSLIRSNNKTEFSAEDFVSLYQKSDVEKVEMKLGAIASTNHINIQKIEGKYRMFVNTSGVNIEALLGEEKVKINPDFIRDRVLSKAEDRIFIKQKYDLKYNMGLYPLGRELVGELFTVKGLKQIGKKRIQESKVEKDGKINFVIPNFDEEYNPEEIINEYKILMEDLPSNVCLAIPKKIIFKREELIEYGALLNLENKNEDVAKNEDIKKLITQRRRKLEDKIRNKYLRKFSNLRNFTFVFSNGNVKNDLRQDISLYKELLYTHYNKFPHEIRVENFDKRGPLNKLVKLFLDGNAEVAKNKKISKEVKHKKTSEEAKNIYATLKPLDLVKITEKVSTENIEFKAPEAEISKLSKEIMDTVEAKEEELTIEEKYNKLSSAPYGLNLPLIDIYFFISNKLGRTYIVSKKTGRPTALDEFNLKKLSDKPSEYEMKKNEVTYVSQEVADVWKALGRINGIRSEAKRVKVNMKNDFNVTTTLGKEMIDIHRIISEKDAQLTDYGIQTGRLKTLSNKLDSIRRPKGIAEVFDELSKLVGIYRKANFDENLEELKKSIKQYNGLTKSEITKIYKIEQILRNLKYKIKDLKGYSDFKGTLKSLEAEYEEYKKDYLNLDLLDNLDEKSIALKSSYDNEFKRKHDEYYNRYLELKIDLEEKEKGKIESIKSFESFDFKNISSIKPFLEELEIFEKCECIEVSGETSCTCELDDLVKVEIALEELEDKFNRKKAMINGIFQGYNESLKELKSEFGEDDDYIDLLMDIGEVEDGNEEASENMEGYLNLLKDKINNHLVNQAEPIRKKVEFKKIEDELSENIKVLGRNEITLEEFSGKVDQILKKYREEGYEGIKISQE